MGTFLYVAAIAFTYYKLSRDKSFCFDGWKLMVVTPVIAVPFCLIIAAGYIVLFLVEGIRSDNREPTQPVAATQTKQTDPRAVYQNPYAFITDDERE